MATYPRPCRINNRPMSKMISQSVKPSNLRAWMSRSIKVVNEWRANPLRHLRSSDCRRGRLAPMLSGIRRESHLARLIQTQLSRLGERI